MANDPVILFAIAFLYCAIAWLIIHEIDRKWHFMSKIKCKLGYHQRWSKALGVVTKQYKCIHCKKPKKHSLKLLSGGKKTIENTFRF